MSTKFNQGKSMKLPVVCHGSLVGLGLPYKNGMPNRMSALASWVDALFAIAIHETFPLHVTAAPWTWSGESSNVGMNLQLDVTRGTGFAHWEINLWLRTDRSKLQLVTWSNVKIPPGPPFDSGRLSHQYPPVDSWDAVHLLD